jgi:hypothetical protein
MFYSARDRTRRPKKFRGGEKHIQWWPVEHSIGEERVTDLEVLVEVQVPRYVRTSLPVINEVYNNKLVEFTVKSKILDNTIHSRFIKAYTTQDKINKLIKLLELRRLVEDA